MRTLRVFSFMGLIIFANTLFGIRGFAANLVFAYKYGPAVISTNDIGSSSKLHAVVTRLATRQWPSGRSDLVSDFVWHQLDKTAADAINNYYVATHGKEGRERETAGPNHFSSIESRLDEILVSNLSRIIDGPCIYQRQRFHDFTLSRKTKDLLAQKPAGDTLKRLNWLLLNDAYPEFARGAIIADGQISGFWKSKETILHIEIYPLKLSEAERQDIWIELSPTERVALADITEERLSSSTSNHRQFYFEGGRLVRFEADVYGFDNRDTIALGSLKRKSALALPCSLADFEKVFGKPDEVVKKRLL